MWTPKPHPLRWPLTLADGTTITELTLQPILHGPHADLMDANDAYKKKNGKDKPESAIFLGLAAMATGLEEADIKRMKKPDFNGLANRVFELVSAPSTRFQDDAEADIDRPRLLVPLACSDGQTREYIDLEVPALEASQMMETQPTARDRAEFITAKCTGLIVHDLQQLTVPDWNTLQGRINDFLNEEGDYFPLETST